MIIVELSGSMDVLEWEGGHASYVPMSLRPLSALLPSQSSYIPQISSSQASTILNLDTCMAIGRTIISPPFFVLYQNATAEDSIWSRPRTRMIVGKKCPKETGPGFVQSGTQMCTDFWRNFLLNSWYDFRYSMIHDWHSTANKNLNQNKN